MKFVGSVILAAALLASATAALAQPSPVSGSTRPVIGVVIGSAPTVAPDGEHRVLYQVRLGYEVRLRNFQNSGPTIEVPWSGVRPIRIGAAVYVAYSNGKPHFSGAPNGGGDPISDPLDNAHTPVMVGSQ